MFEDEATNWTEAFLERLRQGDRIIVPAHWPTEVANALLIAARRRRIKPEQAQALWDELARLPIDIGPALSTARGKDVLALGEKHNLTVYDAVYLELARATNYRWELSMRICGRQRRQRACNYCKTKRKLNNAETDETFSIFSGYHNAVDCKKRQRLQCRFTVLRGTRKLWRGRKKPRMKALEG